MAGERLMVPIAQLIFPFALPIVFLDELSSHYVLQTRRVANDFWWWGGGRRASEVRPYFQVKK